MQPRMLIGFLPTVSWAVCSRSLENRILRGVALLFNGMLGIGRLGGLVLLVFGTAAPRPALEFWGLVLFGLFFTAVAGVNIHAVSNSNKAPAPQARGDHGTTPPAPPCARFPCPFCFPFIVPSNP